MRIGVIADTHIKTESQLSPLKDIVERYLSDVDMILHAGDLVNLAVMNYLEGIAPTVAVCGNMDFPEVKEALPAEKLVEVAGLKIGLTHGWGPPEGLVERVVSKFPEADCVVFGHSHSPYNQLVGGVLCFNPGSPTDKIFTQTNSLGILNLAKDISGEIIAL